MMSVDKCRKGVPFSYATGGYEQADNSFLILNYNDWCVDQDTNKTPCSIVMCTATPLMTCEQPWRRLILCEAPNALYERDKFYMQLHYACKLGISYVAF